jgi:hypothetical protein
MLFTMQQHNSRDYLNLKSYSEGMKRDRAQYQMSIVHDFYQSQKIYPDKIPDGWHIVVAMNNYDFCGEAKVFVRDDTIFQYVVEDWKYRVLVGPAMIVNGRSALQLENEKSKRKKKRIHLDLYFVDYMNDPGTISTPPVPAGKASFWAGDVTGDQVVVFINGEEKGRFSPAYYGSAPGCGEKSTLTIEYKSGTHDFRAINSRNVWRGTITIYPGDCTLQVLTRENNTSSGFTEDEDP